MSEKKDMNHLVREFRQIETIHAIKQLEEAHNYIVSQTSKWISNLINFNIIQWGIEFKRINVELRKNKYGKKSERLSEIVNMMATLERSLDCLKYFKVHNYNWVEVCHPSTSDNPDECDLIMKLDKDGDTFIAIEITDIASSKAGQNNKEQKQLDKLRKVKASDCYICTSEEYSNALISDNRLKKNKGIYERIGITESTEIHKSILLRIIPKESK